MTQVVKPHEPKTQAFTLASGHTIPAVGLGTWKSGSEAANSVFTAIIDVLTLPCFHSYVCLSIFWDIGFFVLGCHHCTLMNE